MAANRLVDGVHRRLAFLFRKGACPSPFCHEVLDSGGGRGGGRSNRGSGDGVGGGGGGGGGCSGGGRWWVPVGWKIGRGRGGSCLGGSSCPGLLGSGFGLPLGPLSSMLSISLGSLLSKPRVRRPALSLQTLESKPILVIGGGTAAGGDGAGGRGAMTTDKVPLAFKPGTGTSPKRVATGRGRGGGGRGAGQTVGAGPGGGRPGGRVGGQQPAHPGDGQFPGRDWAWAWPWA